MKRFIPILVVLGAVLVGVFFQWRQREDLTYSGVSPAQLAPAEAEVLLVLPDVGRMRERWGETALREMTLQPEWQPYAQKLDEFLRTSFGGAETGEVFAWWKDAELASVFAAFSGLWSAEYQWVAGFSYRGKKTAAKAAIERWQKATVNKWPNLKSEMVQFENTEIESVTSTSGALALAYRDNWFLVASGVEPMKALLRRYDGAEGGLERSPRFVERRKQATPDADFQACFDLAKISRNLDRAVEAAGPELKKKFGGRGSFGSIGDSEPNGWPTAAVYSLKMEGREMRGRCFFELPEKGRENPIRFDSSRSSHIRAHLLSYVSPLPWGTERLMGVWDRISESAIHDSEMFTLLAKGLKVGDATAVFGPEAGMKFEQGDGAARSYLALKVRDPSRARECAEAIAKEIMDGKTSPVERSGPEGNLYWGRRDYLRFGLLLGKYLLFGKAGNSTIWRVYGQSIARENSLDSTPPFQALRQRLPAEALAVANVEMGKAVEEFCDPNTIAYAKQATIRLSKKTVAGMKLKGEFFAQHLGPLCAVYIDLPKGIAMESLGPLPFEETLLPDALSWAWSVLVGPMQP